ncbi:DUF1302 domain-containing protein [Gallaecimonas xiamenensis]|uniref:DUF1302 domain-containing protein n=1 Tax=Gallaecimonas xiamenensis 3-C-1 TaxID=745411 RepID=K2JP26_9GAMM|nr:DUF1302 domain-containing protein [Gallaecimonas xiamenensis]EKE72184.1 hypothetical protein B3C1_11449 [Gallaecimonas xiamenensis 3-C-1]
MRKEPQRFARHPLAMGVTVALFGMMSMQAQAVSFTLGDEDQVEVSFDSTFSLGASWRAEDRNMDLIGKANQPQFRWTSPYTYPQNDVWMSRGAYSNNGDNGDLNFDKWDNFSTVFKGVHELSIKYQDYGAFIRGMYFYDFALNDGNFAWENPVSGSKSDPCRDKDAEELACKDIRLLDAYVYGDWFFGAEDETVLSVRLGQQVVNWGESTFIPHGLSEINPIDVGRLKAPGADLKEAYIPVGMLWSSLAINENWSIEAFYQYDWEHIYIDSPGTYFSTNDFAGEGGYYNNVQFGFGGRVDLDLDGLTAALNADPTQLANLFNYVALKPKGGAGEREPDDGGQYGLKLNWYSPELGDTEFGLYFMNYHSRRPIISAIAADPTKIGSDIAYIASLGGGLNEDSINNLESFTTGFLEYPEDIKMYGFSFNTNIGTTAFSGEITHRQDEPIQVDDIELIYAAYAEQLAKVGRPELANISQLNPVGGGDYGFKDYIQGYRLVDDTQAQFTLTHLFGPTLGASSVALVFEVGGIKIHDMPDQSELRFNGPGTDRSGPIAGKEGLALALQDGVETNPFPDDFAWGYRALAKFDYPNVFAGVNVSPRIFFSHDVKGITPDPMFLFIEDRKQAAVGVNFDYQSRWSVDFSYSAFWGAVGTTDRLDDRDFVSLSVKYSI